MLLNLEQRKTHKDIEISIIYPEKNKTVEKIIYFINSLSIKIEGYAEYSVKQINAPIAFGGAGFILGLYIGAGMADGWEKFIPIIMGSPLGRHHRNCNIFLSSYI